MVDEERRPVEVVKIGDNLCANVERNIVIDKPNAERKQQRMSERERCQREANKKEFDRITKLVGAKVVELGFDDTSGRSWPLLERIRFDNGMTVKIETEPTWSEDEPCDAWFVVKDFLG